MSIDLSKLPDGFKLEVTKDDLIAFANHLLEQHNNPFGTEEEQPIGVAEVAKLLNVSVQHIYSCTSEKKIPFFKKGKRCYFFKSAIIKWVKEGRQKTDEEIQDMANEYLERSRSKRK